MIFIAGIPPVIDGSRSGPSPDGSACSVYLSKGGDDRYRELCALVQWTSFDAMVGPIAHRYRCDILPQRETLPEFLLELPSVRMVGNLRVVTDGAGSVTLPILAPTVAQRGAVLYRVAQPDRCTGLLSVLPVAPDAATVSFPRICPGTRR